MERTIEVLGDIKDLSELLGAASIDQIRLFPAGGRLKLDLELTRACLEAVPAGGSGGFRRKTPWVKSRLVLNQIRNAAFERLESGSSQVSMLACDSIGGGYTFSVTSHDGLRLVLNLEALKGEFQDIGKPIVAT